MATAIAKVGFGFGFGLTSLSSSPPPSPPRRSNLSFSRVSDTSFGCCKRRSTPLCLVAASSSLVDDQQLSSSSSSVSFTEAENLLIEAVIGIQGRGRSASPQQIKDVENAIQVLEAAQEGVSDPTSSSLIEGRWQLIFTTRPGTASPIQRTFVGVDYFNVFQEVFLRTEDPRVSNIVQFSDAIGELKVEAAASINDGTRILFRFDRAAFSFKFLPFKVPYPVPFRLLGDEAKGWLDTTYLSHSGNIRISKGNKGTTFVLQKKTDPRQRLLSAISTGAGVTEAIDYLVTQTQLVGKGESELPVGEWQLLWSSQVCLWLSLFLLLLFSLFYCRKTGTAMSIIKFYCFYLWSWNSQCDFHLSPPKIKKPVLVELCRQFALALPL
ncbi:hypothetical protein AQUCO_00900028v1 [Aquilegia coerulea]|uniref:Plastid lipid-associated protein/fibrillin conserved domain-containing protein n=1 Tax=Aquilegia coerulea TaxID=218851 RepID=A0A2G5EBJ2_AQUCA|nr:hypothetical protein AQUCO_00900028v1 [Aquilegia coerulea]